MPRSYSRERYYSDRKEALREAKRLRKTGKYNAKVLRTTVPSRPPWTLWTQRTSDRP